MSDQPADEPAADLIPSDEEPWLDRARAAAVTILRLVERNPSGTFLTGLPVEPWQPAPHPLHPGG